MSRIGDRIHQVKELALANSAEGPFEDIIGRKSNAQGIGWNGPHPLRGADWGTRIRLLAKEGRAYAFLAKMA